MTKEPNGQEVVKGTNDSSPQSAEGGTDLSEVSQLRAQLEEAQKNAQFLKDQLLRKAAEFENYKRRTETESLNFIRSANEGLISALLPILDDFVRSLKVGQEAKDFDAFYKGVELILAKLQKVLDHQGVKRFESVGKPFDVDYHDAMLQVPRPDVPPQTVIEEVEPGYMLHGRVLRHAKVIVSSAVDEQPTGEPSPSDGDPTSVKSVE